MIFSQEAVEGALGVSKYLRVDSKKGLFFWNRLPGKIRNVCCVSPPSLYLFYGQVTLYNFSSLLDDKIFHHNIKSTKKIYWYTDAYSDS